MTHLGNTPARDPVARTITPPLRGSRRSRAASPHFSPGGVMMAQEFFPQRVLASEERSGHYVRASMCALRGKGQARARPAPSLLACPHKKANNVLKIHPFHNSSSDPVRNTGLPTADAVGGRLLDRSSPEEHRFHGMERTTPAFASLGHPSKEGECQLPTSHWPLITTASKPGRAPCPDPGHGQSSFRPDISPPSPRPSRPARG